MRFVREKQRGENEQLGKENSKQKAETRTGETKDERSSKSFVRGNHRRTFASARKKRGETMKIVDPKIETQKHSYTKQAREFADGRNGYHKQVYEFFDNGVATGVMEHAEKKSHAHRWIISYSYKGKEYASVREAIKVYERGKDERR